MKKLLSILGAVVLTASSSIPISGWATASASKSQDQKYADYVSEATSFAFRGAILNDQNVKMRNGNDKDGIDFSYATSYFGKLKINEVLKDAFKNSQGVRPSDEDVVSTAYGSLLGYDRNYYSYTLKDSITSGDLTTAGVKQDTNLYNIVKDNSWDNPTGEKPDTKTQGILAMVISALQMALGSDFSAPFASMLIDVLSGPNISGKILSDSVKEKLESVDAFLNTYSDSLKNALASLTQSENTEGKLKDKLSEATNQLFEALIFLTTNKQGNNSDAASALVYDDTKSVEDYGDAATRFWDHLLGTKNDDKNDDSYGLKPAAGDLKQVAIEQYAKIINFVMNFVHFCRSLDNFDKNISNSQDGDYLFSAEKNDKVKEKVLNSDIKDDSNWWFTDGDKKFAKINLQNLFSDLSYFFSPNKNHQLRFINAIFGGVYDSEKNESKLNPIMDISLTPLLQIASKKASGTIKTVLSILQKIPGIGPVTQKINEILNNLPKYANELLDWFSTDNSKDLADSVIPSTISSLISIINATGIFSAKNIEKNLDIVYSSVPSDKKNLTVIIFSALQWIANCGQYFVDKPWSYIFSSVKNHTLIMDISNLIYFTYSESSTTTIRKIGYELKHIKSLKHALAEMKISDLFDSVVSILKKNIILPDWLYKSKDYTVSSLFAAIAKDNFKTKDTNSLALNQGYSISAEPLSNLLSSLMPHSSDQTDQIRITRRPAWISSMPSCDDTTTPFLNLPNYIPENKEITILTFNVPDGDAKDLITGINKNQISSAEVKDGKLTIKLNTALSQKNEAYGQEITYTSKDGKSASVACFVPAKGKTSEESVSSLMAFYYSLENFSKNQQGLDSLKLGSKLYWDYYIQLPEQDKAVSLITNASTGNNVNQNALRDILGLTKKDGIDVFAKNSPFEAISQLYGHNYIDGVEHDDMKKGASSIFGLASEFSDFATNSIQEIVDTYYKPYYLESNWKVDNISYYNLEPATSSIDEKQWIKYDMHFYNYSDKKWYTYKIRLDRTPYDSNNHVGWKLVQLMREN